MVVSIAALLAGCDFSSAGDFGVIESPPEMPVGETGGVTVETAPTADTGPAAPSFECVDIWATDDTSQVVDGNTTGAADRRRPSCVTGGAEDGPDLFVGFVAPSSGIWVFDLSAPSQSFDTVIAVLDSCGGNELACDDDELVVNRSRVELPLLADETVIIQVDGYSPTDFGPFSLSIEPL